MQIGEEEHGAQRITSFSYKLMLILERKTILMMQLMSC